MRDAVPNFSQLSTKRWPRQRRARDPAIVRSVGTVIFIIRRKPPSVPSSALAVLFLLAAFRERIKEKERTREKERESERERKREGERERARKRRGGRRRNSVGRGSRWERGVVSSLPARVSAVYSLDALLYSSV